MSNAIRLIRLPSVAFPSKIPLVLFAAFPPLVGIILQYYAAVMTLALSTLLIADFLSHYVDIPYTRSLQVLILADIALMVIVGLLMPLPDVLAVLLQWHGVVLTLGIFTVLFVTLLHDTFDIPVWKSYLLFYIIDIIILLILGLKFLGK